MVDPLRVAALDLGGAMRGILQGLACLHWSELDLSSQPQLKSTPWIQKSYLPACSASWGGAVSADAQQIIYVNNNAASPGAGLSWNAPLDDLQFALDVAEARVVATQGDTVQVWVAASRDPYLPTLDVSGNVPLQGADRTKTFKVAPGVHVYGGFEGTEVQLIDRRPELARYCVLSGDIERTTTDTTDDCFTVVTVPNPSTNPPVDPQDPDGDNLFVVLDSLTITSGNADGAAATLEAFSGGGLFAENSRVRVTRCAFISNRAIEAGGAAAVGRVGAAQFGCIFNRCTFVDNHAVVGGALFIRSVGSSTSEFFPDRSAVVGCRFRSNSAVNPGPVAATRGIGGAICVGPRDGQLFISNCIMEKNVASNQGSAIHFVGPGPSSGFVLVDNCTVVGNGFAPPPSAPTGLPTTPPTARYAIYYADYSSAMPGDEIHNSIVRGNGDGLDPQVGPSGLPTSAVVIRSSNLQGGWPGQGFNNIDQDPMFVGAGDYRLVVGSPCIDSGDSGLLPPDIADSDFDGNDSLPLPVDIRWYQGPFVQPLNLTPRIAGVSVDMGAFEMQ